MTRPTRTRVLPVETANAYCFAIAQVLNRKAATVTAQPRTPPAPPVQGITPMVRSLARKKAS